MSFFISIIFIFFGVKFIFSSGDIKYFAVDIDRTFYIKNTNQFKKNIECFKNVKDKNVTIFFCTGRDRSSAMKLVGDEFTSTTNYNGYPGVYCNGSVVYDTQGNVINHIFFERDFLENFVQHITTKDSKNATVFLEKDKFYALETLNKEFSNYASKNQIHDVVQISTDDLYQKKIVKILIDKEGIQGFSGKCNCFPSASGSKFHVTPLDSNKLKGVEILLKHLKAGDSQYAFIGDWYNDIELMKSCPNSFAVANAVEDAKKNAKKVLSKNFDDGAFQEAVEILFKESDSENNT